MSLKNSEFFSSIFTVFQTPEQLKGQWWYGFLGLMNCVAFVLIQNVTESIFENVFILEYS